MRICKACQTGKPENREHFKPNEQGRLGLDATCRPCRNAYTKAWRAKNRERLARLRREQYAADNGERWRAKEAAREQRAPVLRKAQRLVQGAWDRSRKSGQALAPELRSVPFVLAWLMRQPNCACCERPFDLTAGRNDDGAGPSLDRFRCEDGYTLANTELICLRCNLIKRNYNHCDLMIVAQWIREREDSSNAE